MISKLVLTLLIFTIGAIAKASTDDDCRKVRADFKDSQELSGSPIFSATVDKTADGKCFVQLTFFGNKNMADFIAYRIANKVRPDKEELNSSSSVPFFLNTPTIMQDEFLGLDGKPLDPFGTEVECVDVAQKYLSVAGVARTNVVRGKQSYLNGNCYVEVKFQDVASYAKFIQARTAAVDDFILDKALLKRPGTPENFMVFVQLWYSVQ